MKNLVKSAVLSLCMLMAVSFAYAADSAKDLKNTGKKAAEVQRGPNFVDADGDGVCDNFKTKPSSK